MGATAKQQRLRWALMLAFAGVTALFAAADREPRIEGKRISALLADMSDNDSRIRQDAERILRAADPEVIPSLIKSLNRKNALYRDYYNHLRAKLPAFTLHLDWIPYMEDRAIYRYNAANALSEFGSAAIAAIPDLRRLLRDEDPMVRFAAAGALGSIGPSAREAVPDLLAFVRSSDAYSHVITAGALWRIDPNAHQSLATRILVAGVTEDYNTALNAIALLDEMGKVDLAIEPLLKVMRTGETASRRHQATNLLRRIQRQYPGPKPLQGTRQIPENIR